MTELLMAAVIAILPGALFAAEPDVVAPVKAWRQSPAPGEKVGKKTFEAVLTDDTIRYGNKTIKLSPDSSFTCSTPEAGTVLISRPAYFWLKEKGADNWKWQSRNLDKTRSKFYRSGRKYVWELWYGAKDIEPFQGLTQTLEVLEDSRLCMTYRYTLPAKTADREFKTYSHYLCLPGQVWLGAQLDLAGQTLRLEKDLKRTVGRRVKQAPLEWTFGGNDPAKCFSVRIEGKNNYMFALTYHAVNNEFMLKTDSPGNNTPSMIFLDFRKGTSSGAKPGDLRCGVDFLKQENLLMPDNHHKNLVENSSFERGLEGWHNLFLNRTREWDWKPFELDDQTAYEGKHSLRMEARKGVDWIPVNAAIGPQLMIVEPGKYTLSFYAKSAPDEKNTLTVWLPHHTGAGQVPPPINNRRAKWDFTLTGEWKRCSVTFPIAPDETHLFPSFYVRNPAGKGTVWLDAVQLEKGGRATAYEARPAEGRLLTASPDNFISSKAKIDGRFRITTAKPDAEGTVRFTVRNFYGDILLDKKNNFRTGTDRTAELDLPLDSLPGLGVFAVKAEYEMKDGTRAYDLRRYAKVEFQDRPRPNKRMFGIDYQFTCRQYIFPARLDRWKKLGIGAKHWARALEKDEWDMYEKYDVMPYAYSLLSYFWDWSSGQPRVKYFFIADPDRAEELRKNTWPDGKPLTAGNDPRALVWDFHFQPGGKLTPDYLKKVEDAAAKWSARYPFVRMWCLGGEVTCKMPADWWGKGATEQDIARIYAQYLKAFAAGIRKGNPKAKVFQDCPSNMNPSGGIAETGRLLAECGKLGVKFDLIAIHPYRNSPESPDLDRDTERLLSTMAAHGCGDLPVLWSEGMHWGPYDIPQWGVKSSTWIGAPTTWRRGPLSYDIGWTEKRSAAWYARAWLVALKYSDRIIGATSGQTINNCYMDVLQTPFAAQLVPNTLCAILGDAKFKKDIRFAPYIRTYVFEDAQKRPVAAVWCHNENIDNGTADAPVVSADFGTSLETILDFMNTPRKFQPGKVRFAASSFPLFFRGKPGTLAQMTAALEKAELVSGSAIAPIEVSANPKSLTAAGVTLRNFVSREFSGELNGRKITVPAARQAFFSLPLPVPLRTDALVPVKLPVTLKTDKGAVYHYDFDFEAFAAKRVPDKADIDTLDWSALPQIPFPRKLESPRTTGGFRIGWNSQGIFLETRVRDAKFVFTEYPRIERRWRNDCIQVYFDTFANARQRTFLGYDEDDYDYSVFPNVQGTSAIVFRNQTVEAQLGLATSAPKDKTFAPDIPCTFSNQDGVLTCRVFFPAKYLLPMKLRKGWVFGFALFVVDSNRPGHFDGAWVLTKDGKVPFNRPHTWPAVILTE